MAWGEASRVGWPAGWIPAAVVELLRADVLQAAPEMVREIEEHVPEYASHGDRAREQTLRRGVDLALRRYVELIDQHVGRAGPWRPAANWRGLYRAVGANERRAGRGLEALHAAVRMCARVATRRLQACAGRHALPAETVAWLSEAIFDNIDDIARASAEGYAQAQLEDAAESDRRRRHVLEVLLADPPPSERTLAGAAAAARWRLPRRLAVVVLAATPARPPLLGPEILTAYDRAVPCLILPDPEGRAQVRAVVNGLAGHRAAVGLAVAPGAAGRSLRWARLALELAGRGLLPDDRILWCGDHLAALAVFQDTELVAALAQRRLEPLSGLRADRREVLADTLLAWLTFNMNANEVAAHLHVHPQTVRQRLRQLTALFGDAIRDPRLRFELELALRSRRAQRRAGGGRPPAGPAARSAVSPQAWVSRPE